MKKIIIGILVVLLAASLVLAISGMTKEQRQNYNICKKNCSTTKMLDKLDCNTIGSQCRDGCRSIKNEQKENISSEYNICRSECDNTTNALNLTDLDFRNQSIVCKRNCTAQKRDDSKLSLIEYISCNKECSDSKNDCKQQANYDFESCGLSCLNVTAPDNSTGTVTNGTNSTDGNSTNNNSTTEDYNPKIFCRYQSTANCGNETEPVCTNRKSTYVNGCLACQNHRTIWYKKGEC